MNLNGYQWFLIVVSVLSAVAGGSAQLTDLLGAGTAHTVVTLATFLNTMITAIMTPLVGNASMVKTVAALPGVDKVQINTNASAEVAAVAVDPDQPKVGATSAQDRPALQQIAKG